MIYQRSGPQYHEYLPSLEAKQQKKWWNINLFLCINYLNKCFVFFYFLKNINKISGFNITDTCSNLSVDFFTVKTDWPVNQNNSVANCMSLDNNSFHQTVTIYHKWLINNRYLTMHWPGFTFIWDMAFRQEKISL